MKMDLTPFSFSIRVARHPLKHPDIPSGQNPMAKTRHPGNLPESSGTPDVISDLWQTAFASDHHPTADAARLAGVTSREASARRRISMSGADGSGKLCESDCAAPQSPASKRPDATGGIGLWVNCLRRAPCRAAMGVRRGMMKWAAISSGK
jgi:hypothetical protein